MPERFTRQPRKGVRRARLTPTQGSVDYTRAINELKSERKFRTRFFGAVGVGGTAFAVGVGAMANKFLNPYFSESVSKALLGAGIAALGAVAGMHAAESSSVRKATQKVGVVLHSELKKSPLLREFLEKYSYVFVDRKGNLVGTNHKRWFLRVGRIRLESKKIIAGEY